MIYFKIIKEMNRILHLRNEFLNPEKESLNKLIKRRGSEVSAVAEEASSSLSKFNLPISPHMCRLIKTSSSGPHPSIAHQPWMEWPTVTINPLECHADWILNSGAASYIFGNWKLVSPWLDHLLTLTSCCEWIHLFYFPFISGLVGFFCMKISLESCACKQAFWNFKPQRLHRYSPLGNQTNPKLKSYLSINCLDMCSKAGFWSKITKK